MPFLYNTARFLPYLRRRSLLKKFAALMLSLADDEAADRERARRQLV